MQSSRSTIVLTLFWLMVLTTAVSAEVPGQLGYQGQLLDSEGQKVRDEIYVVTFRIYDGGGTRLWEEAYEVETTDGTFIVELGSRGEPLTAEIFDQDECWLGITVGSDEELRPRTRLLSTPYAYLAQKAADAATLQGQTPSTFSPVAHVHAGEDITSGSISPAVFDAYINLLISGRLDGSTDTDLLPIYLLELKYARLDHEHDASQIVSGVLHTDAFSAFDDLVAEGRFSGSPSSSLVTKALADFYYAASDHEHSGLDVMSSLSVGGYLDNDASSDLLMRSQADSRYASTVHSHIPSPAQCKFSYQVLDGATVTSYATINADGTRIGGSALNSVFWDASNQRYELFLTISGFDVDTHNVIVTPISDQPYFTTIGMTSSNNLLIYIWQ